MIHSNHSLAWFEQRVDTIIYRNNRPFPITNKRDAVYCHDLQAKGFNFADHIKSKIKVHVIGNNCQSCEG